MPKEAGTLKPKLFLAHIMDNQKLIDSFVYAYTIYITIADDFELHLRRQNSITPRNMISSIAGTYLKLKAMGLLGIAGTVVDWAANGSVEGVKQSMIWFKVKLLKEYVTNERFSKTDSSLLSGLLYQTIKGEFDENLHLELGKAPTFSELNTPAKMELIRRMGGIPYIRENLKDHTQAMIEAEETGLAFCLMKDGPEAKGVQGRYIVLPIEARMDDNVMVALISTKLIKVKFAVHYFNDRFGLHEDDKGCDLPIAHQTAGSFADLMEALSKSEFKKSLFTLVATLKISTLAGILCDKISPSGFLKYSIGLLDDLFKVTGMLGSLQEICYRLITEILPAIWYRDPSLIKPELFSARMDIIYSAVVAAKTFDRKMMIEVCEKWEPSLMVDPMETEVMFLGVLGKMKRFVTSSSTNHLTSVMRTIIQDLTIVEQQISKYVECGTSRYEPYCIGLTGEAGIGKSTMIPRIQAELAKYLSLPVHKNAEGYIVCDAAAVITEGNKFDSNIHNHTKTVVFDDINLVAPEFQEKGASNMAVKFLQCQGSVPFSLNKAEIEEKKGSYWNNNLTILTANNPNYGFNTQISNEGAWNRRIHVDINMAYTNPEKKDRSNVTYTVSYLNYETSVRTGKVYLDTGLLFQELRAHCLTYVERRRDRQQRILPMCPECKDRINHCLCRFNNRTQQDVHASSALWMSEQESANASLKNVMKMIIFEETAAHALLIVLSPIIGWMVAIMFIGILRELIELVYDKPFDLVRWMMITLSLIAFPFSVLIHMLMNYTLIFEKATAELEVVHAHWVLEVPLVVEQVSRRYIDGVTTGIVNSFTPQWWKDWKWQRLKESARDYKRMAMEKNLHLLGGAAVGMFAIKRVYDLVVATQTAFGDIPKEEDKIATAQLDEQIGGTPEESQDGRTMNNAWKQELKIRMAPGSIHEHGANQKCDFMCTVIAKDKIDQNCKCFLTTEGMAVSKHAILADQAQIHYYNIKTPNEKNYISYDVNNETNLVFNDTIIIPYVSNRRPLSIVRNFEPAKADKFMIESTRCNCLGVTFKAMYGYPYCMIVDYPGRVGLSGSMVTIVEHDGKPVMNRIIGAVVGMIMYGPYKGMCLVEPFFDAAFAARFKDRYKLDVDAFGTTTALCDANVDEAAVVTAASSSTVNPYVGPEYKLLQPQLTPEILAERLYRKYGKSVIPGVAPHSVLRHLRQQNGEILCSIGEHAGHIPRVPAPNKSKFYKTEFYDMAKQIGNVEKYTIPNLSSYVKNNIYHNHLLACARQMNSAGVIIDQTPFWSATALVKNHIKDVLGDELKAWVPYDLKSVIIGDKFTRAINNDASKGFPYKGVKDEWLSGDHDNPVLSKEICDDIADMIKRMDEEDEAPLNISQTSLKDEIISKEKNESAKARVFFAGNTPFLILCRSYLGKLMNLFVQFRDKLFAKIGMNAIGKELHDMAKSMFERVFGIPFDEKVFNWEVWIDGDFEKYDKMLLMMKFAVHCIWWLARELDQFIENPTWLNRIRLILTSFLEYVIILGEDLFIMRDKLPSGVWATALFNCICEMIIEVLMFYYLLYVVNGGTVACDFVTLYYHKHKIDVFKYISIANYGDDNIKCVHTDYLHLYVHELIQRFARWLHMGMTPARKHETRIALKPITEVLFLKRVFTWCEPLKRFVGALEIDSIAKMLAFSDTKNKDEWKHAVIMTARRELSFHGPLIYYKFCDLFNQKQTWEETLNEIESGEWLQLDPYPIVDIPFENFNFN